MTHPQICRRCSHYLKEGQLDMGACQAPRPFWSEKFPMIVPADQDASQCPCFAAGKPYATRVNTQILDRFLNRHRMYGRTAMAVKDVLLREARVSEAARRFSISPQAVSAMLKKLGARKICPACGKPYFAFISEDSSPADEPVPSAL